MYLTLNFVRGQMYKLVGIMALLIISVCFANAQSKKIDNPTPLTSNEISGLIDSDTKGTIYYYSFWANPGEVSITLTVEPGKKVRDFILATASVEISLFDRNAEELSNKIVSTDNNGGSKQVVARVEITKRQIIVLGIKIPIGSLNDNSVGGKYRVRIDGADINQNTSSSKVEICKLFQLGNIEEYRGVDFDYPTELRNTVEKLNELVPKKGTMVVTMKDGSIGLINLSQVANFSIRRSKY